MRRAWLLTMIGILASACAAGGAPEASAPVAGGTLRVAQESELSTLDPARSGLLVEREVYYNLYDSLIGIDSRLDLVPDLATSWTYADLQTLVLTLRQGVSFQDGTPFDADAVKVNLDRFLTDPLSQRRTELASVASVEVRSPHTVALHLSRPDGTLLSQLVDRAGMILSPAVIARGQAVLSQNPVGAGTGPFELVEWKVNDHLTLKRNPSHWRRDAQGRRLPYLAGVIYQTQTDLTATARALRSGALDGARIVDGNDVPALRADRHVVLEAGPGVGYNGVWLNAGAPPFDDPAKRRAFALAVDRAAIVREAIHDLGSVSYGPLTPGSWGYDPGERIYDQADRARARATATGFGFTLKVGDDQEDMRVASMVQADLAAAGITATLLAEPYGRVSADGIRHDFQAALINWSGRIDPDGNMYFFHKGASHNYSQYSNPEVDQLLEHARLSTDQPKRKQLYQEAQRLIVEEAPYIFIDDPASLRITRSTVHGFTLYPDGINRYAAVWLA